METQEQVNGPAPGGEAYRLGAKGGVMALAWQYVWDRLSRTEWRDGVALSLAAGEAFDVKPASVLSHLHRMAREGVIVGKQINVDGTRGVRPRTHYRIPDERAE